MQIPIQNIYYLLCYAWNKLDESEVVDVKAIDSTELIDLFAKVLSNGLSRLLKQGLDRYYIEHEEAVSGIKGKLNLSETIKQNILPLSKTVCVFDEFDYNVLHNQILKTTIGKLLHTKNLDATLKEELHRLYIKLPPISEIIIRKAHFKQIRLHRNNYHYDFILKVCQILNENLFIDESKGSYKFMDFIRKKESMGKLFEQFVKNFYKIETDYLVSSEAILWQFDSDSKEDIQMLPYMYTDVSLKSKSRKIIIDTKFYKEAFKTRFDKPKISSSNLYQLFSYLKNQETELEITRNCEGILLYPSIHQDFEHTFKYENHKIRVMSINLNQDWKQIRADLLKIVA